MRECLSLKTLTLSILTVAPSVVDLPTTPWDFKLQRRQHQSVLDANCEVLLSAPQALQFVELVWLHVGPYEPEVLSDLESLSDSWVRIDDALSGMPHLEGVMGIVTSEDNFGQFISEIERSEEKRIGASANDAPLYELLTRVLPRVYAAGLLESCSLSGV